MDGQSRRFRRSFSIRFSYTSFLTSSSLFRSLLFGLRNSWQSHNSENSVSQWNGSLSIQFTCYALLLMLERDGINPRKLIPLNNVSNQNISTINTIQILSNHVRVHFFLSLLKICYFRWKCRFVHYLTCWHTFVGICILNTFKITFFFFFTSFFKVIILFLNF